MSACRLIDVNFYSQSVNRLQGCILLQVMKRVVIVRFKRTIAHRSDGCFSLSSLKGLLRGSRLQREELHSPCPRPLLCLTTAAGPPIAGPQPGRQTGQLPPQNFSRTFSKRLNFFVVWYNSK